MPQYDTATNIFSLSDFQKITGLSDWTYNIAGFYGKDGITTRLSYNRRSAYVRSYGTDILGRTTTWRTKPISRLDFSSGYDVSKQPTFSFDATNLLAKPFNNFTTDNYGYEYAQDVRDEGRYYGLGVRFRLGIDPLKDGGSCPNARVVGSLQPSRVVRPHAKADGSTMTLV